MVANIEIEFFNPVPVYFAGQTISGQVKITCNKQEGCKAIYIILKGQAHVQWTENRSSGTGKNRRTYTETYRSNEVYYLTEMLVWGNGSKDSELPIGIHVFQFSFVLPINAPSSYESIYGHVRHVCAVKFVKPSMRKINSHAARPFTVVDLYDLNLDPQAKQPIVLQHSKMLGVLFFKSGPISFVLNIDRSGFVPGENILINAECSNKSKKKVSKTKATIYQITTFKARGKIKVINHEIASIIRPEIASGGDDIWSGVPLNIPPVPSSHLRGCSIIDIRYMLQFTMDPSGLSLDLDVKVPIVIGSVPLQQTFNNFVTPSIANNAYVSNQATPEPSAPSFQNLPSIEQYPEMPKPSFTPLTEGKSITHDYDIDDATSGLNNQWTPQYISYNLSQDMAKK